jgi:hypothetical protein
MWGGKFSDLIFFREILNRKFFRKIFRLTSLPTTFICIISFYEAFEYGDGAKFWDYAGTNAEPLYNSVTQIIYLAPVKNAGGVVLARTSCFTTVTSHEPCPIGYVQQPGYDLTLPGSRHDAHILALPGENTKRQ